MAYCVIAWFIFSDSYERERCDYYLDDFEDLDQAKKAYRVFCGASDLENCIDGVLLSLYVRLFEAESIEAVLDDFEHGFTADELGGKTIYASDWPTSADYKKEN